MVACLVGHILSKVVIPCQLYADGILESLQPFVTELANTRNERKTT